MIRNLKKQLKSTWKNMHSRCYVKSANQYVYYGGSGIRVSKRWHKFENFFWDMFDGYCDGLSIDRIDNSKWYSKGNCKWSTPLEQAQNRRPRFTVIKSKKIYFPNKSKMIKDLINIHGIKHCYIQDQLGVSKGGLNYILQGKGKPERINEIRNILENHARDLLADLKKS